MYYIYKHYDKHGQVIYCGKTTRMNNRQREHLQKSIWKDNIHKITFCEVENKTIMDLYEIYLINTINPKFNTQDKRNDGLECVNFKNYEFMDYDIDLAEFKRNIKIKQKPTNLSYDYYGKYVCLTSLCDFDGFIQYDKNKLMKFFNMTSERALEIFIKSLEENKLLSKVNKVLNLK